MKDFFNPEPAIFGNAGKLKSVPGNTREAIESIFSDGADVASLNLQLSVDGHVMAISNPLLDEICDGAGPVSDYTREQLLAFDAAYRFRDEDGSYPLRGKGYKFMTLEEILKSFPDKKFSFTLINKDAALVQKYISIIKENKAEKRVLTASMSGKFIKAVRKALPESVTAFSFAGMIGVYALFKTGILYFIHSFRADVLHIPETIGVSYFANRGLVNEMHKKDIRVYVWDVRSENQLKRLQDAAVDGFITDDVSMAVKNRTVV